MISRRPEKPPFATRALLSCSTIVTAALALACSSTGSGACELADADGIIDGNDVFVLTVTDADFDPRILNAQNPSNVTLTLRSEGSADAGFSVDCLPTPNEDGCPMESCFPPEHVVEPIAPGQSAMVQFQLPEVEGEYVYRALSDDDSRTGQFLIQ